MISEFHLTVAVLTALFLHVVEDFHLQGLLADMKQKSWWLNNVFSKGFNHKYDKDYLAALALHGFEWSFLVCLPILWVVYTYDAPIWLWAVPTLINAPIHSVIDDMKCNRLRINLITDQTLHIVQVVVTYIAVAALI